ncbi:MAG: hypothetical protein CL570_00340 [Alphaproteobacteria bacterium]|nr:hypothetical protein [Alphaproteobacteria bacterium]|tara:strand:+ start:8748 stop:9275 length:528 start_codon:yes stop_codon:yes gene_type:complete
MLRVVENYFNWVILLLMIIRRAVSQDSRTIYNFVLSLDREDAEVRPPAMTIEDIANAGFSEDPLYEAYIAETEGGDPLGAVSFFKGYSGWHARPVAVVHMLYISKEARRQNLAHKLMAQVASIVVERGWARIQLCVEAECPAIHFYESIGMKDSQEKHYMLEGDALTQLAASSQM